MLVRRVAGSSKMLVRRVAGSSKMLVRRVAVNLWRCNMSSYMPKHGPHAFSIVTAASILGLGSVAHASTMPNEDVASTPPEVTIYQYEICPFCNKLKSVMDFYGLPYATVEVNPFTKAEIKAIQSPESVEAKTAYLKVPIAVVDGEQVNDSSVIIERVLSRAGLGQDPLNSSAEVRQWCDWSSDKLAVLLFPVMTRTLPLAAESFGYIWDVDHFSLVQKVVNCVVGPFFMWLAQGKIKKKYGIEDEQQALDDAIDTWMDFVGDKQYSHSNGPTLADVSVYGVLRSLQGLSVHSDLLQKHPDFAQWYARMDANVKENAFDPSTAVSSPS